MNTPIKQPLPEQALSALLGQDQAIAPGVYEAGQAFAEGEEGWGFTARLEVDPSQIQACVIEHAGVQEHPLVRATWQRQGRAWHFAGAQAEYGAPMNEQRAVALFEDFAQALGPAPVRARRGMRAG